MRILQVHPGSSFFGGADLVVTRLNQYFTENKVYNEYITNKLPDKMVHEMGGTLIQEIRKTNKIIAIWSLKKALEERCKALKPDAILAHNFPATLACYPICKYISTIWVCNEPPEVFSTLARKPLEAINRWIVKKYLKGIIVADMRNAMRVEKLYRVIPKVIPYGIDTNFFSQCKRGPSKDLTILHVSTVQPNKGQIDTLKLVYELKKHIKEVKCTLVGEIVDRKYYQELFDFIRGSKLEGNITFTGDISREALRDGYLSKASLLFHPIQEQGGWLIPFEAICAGVPVVVGKRFTGLDIIEKNSLAYAYEELSGAVDYIRYKWEKGFRVDERAKEWVMENLTWGKYGQAVLEYIKEVI